MGMKTRPYSVWAWNSTKDLVSLSHRLQCNEDMIFKLINVEKNPPCALCDHSTMPIFGASLCLAQLQLALTWSCPYTPISKWNDQRG